MLSIAGGALGLLLALAMSRALLAFLPTGTTPMALTARPDWTVFGFTIGISLLTGVLFGLAPALQSSRG